MCFGPLPCDGRGGLGRGAVGISANRGRPFPASPCRRRRRGKSSRLKPLPQDRRRASRPMTPTIRDAIATDRDWLADCAIAMALETEHKQLDPGTVRAGVAAGIADPAKARYFVAVDGDGASVGT